MVKLFQQDRLITNLQKREFVILSSVTGAMSSLADVISTVAMCYFLASHRSGFRKTRQLIRILIFYTVNRGVLVTACQIVIFVAFAINQIALWWMPPHLILSKLHVITLLALLNSRKKMRARDDDTLGSLATDSSGTGSSYGARAKDKPKPQQRYSYRIPRKHEHSDRAPSEPSAIAFNVLSLPSNHSELDFGNDKDGEGSHEHSKGTV